MWFFIAEGYHYTHDLKKYAARLFLLAAISHFSYNFCFGIPFIPFRTTAFNQTGVVWSLAWGLILLYIHDKKAWKLWQKILVTIIICLITFPSDWSCIATMAILAIGTNREKIPLLWLYNRKRGSMKGIGKIFYIYIPYIFSYAELFVSYYVERFNIHFSGSFVGTPAFLGYLFCVFFTLLIITKDR